MSKNSRNAQKLSTPSNVESQIIVTTENNTEVTNNVEFEIMPDSEEVTPAEPAKVETIDNNAMQAFMAKVESQMAEQKANFESQIEMQRLAIENLAKEKEELKAKAIKVIDPVEMEKRLKEAKLCEARQTFLQSRIDDLKICKRHMNETFVNLTNESHNIVFPFNNTVFVGELLDKMQVALQEEHDEKGREIKDLMTF